MFGSATCRATTEFINFRGWAWQEDTEYLLLRSLVDLGPLSKALSALRIEELVLQLNGCPNVPLESKRQLYRDSNRAPVPSDADSYTALSF